MKRKVYIVLTSLLVLLGIALCVLNSPAFQRHLVRVITLDLIDKSGTNLYVERAAFNLFRGVILHNVTMSDSLGKPILAANRLEAGVRLIPLLKRRVELHTVRIIQADIRLTKEKPDSPLNISRLLSSFKRSEKRAWQVTFSNIVVRKSAIHFDILSEPELDEGFDPNHIAVEELSALARLNLSPQEEASTLIIQKLEATRCCGLRLKNLSGEFNLNNERASIRSFNLETEGSSLNCPELTVTYPQLATALTHIDSLSFSPMQLNGKIMPSEWAFLIPDLSLLEKPVTYTLNMQGTVKKWDIKRIFLSLEDIVRLEGSASLTNVTRLSAFSAKSRINQLTIKPKGLALIQQQTGEEAIYLTSLQQLGDIGYKGNLAYNKQTVDLTGEFTTPAGQLTTNATVAFGKNNAFHINGQLITEGFNLSALTNEPNQVGNVAMDIHLEGIQKPDSAFTANILGTVSKLELFGYTYHNINLDGYFSNNSFQGYAGLVDENVRLNFTGLVNFSDENNRYQFRLTADDVNLHALKLLKQEGDSRLSFLLEADFNGKTTEDLQGDLNIRNLSYKQKDNNLTIKNISAKAIQGPNQSSLILTSDVLDATINGRFNLNQLRELVNQMADRYIPSAFTLHRLDEPALTGDIEIRATLHPSVALMNLLNVPVSYSEPIHLDANYRVQSNTFRIKAEAPHFTYNKTAFESINLLIENPLNEIKCLAHARTGKNDTPLDLDLDVRASNNQASYKFFWSNSGNETHTGILQGNMVFNRNEEGISSVNVHVTPSEIILSDSTWHIHPASLRFNEGKIAVESFQLSHRDEFIRINGTASSQLNDTLFVSFNSFKLDDVLRLLPAENANLLVGGRITGKANCPHILQNGTLDADLSIESFSLNKQVMGNLQASTTWDNLRRALELDGTLYSAPEDDSTVTVLATASGDYMPFTDSLILNIDAHHVNMGFLEPYLETVVQNMKAVGSGHVKLIGPMKKLGIHASVFAEQVSFNIGMLNTTYSFSDSIHLSPTRIQFDNVRVTDREGNYGFASCLIRHNKFKEMDIQLNVDLNNMLVMDLPETPNALFYGKAYGSGTVIISGMNEDISLDVNMRTEDRTKVTISPQEATEELDDNFMQFVSFNRRARPSSVIPPLPKVKSREPSALMDKPVNMKINLQIEATPSAELTLITDPNTGDEIKSTGSGAIRAVFDANSDINLFGRYTIESGSYKFIYENLLRRDFTIVRGSSINFSGDPFAAQLDITANHTVDAQLFDLIPSNELASLNLSKNSIPVNCVLNLGGELQRPDISLDMSFPSADDELVRRIKTVINTEEQVNQQIVYLLLFGRFSSPSTGTQTGQSNVTSVLNTAISTLSSQVNSILNNAFGYSNLSFDLDYQNAAFETGMPGEFKVGLTGQWLDDRLTIQGNVGSREDLNQAGTSQFIGEFDIKLRMKNSEKWSWKLFNRANDNQYFKSALNTQGFGVVYNEEFNHPSELFDQLRKGLAAPFSK